MSLGRPQSFPLERDELDSNAEMIPHEALQGLLSMPTLADRRRLERMSRTAEPSADGDKDDVPTIANLVPSLAGAGKIKMDPFQALKDHLISEAQESEEDLIQSTSESDEEDIYGSLDDEEDVFWPSPSSPQAGDSLLHKALRARDLEVAKWYLSSLDIGINEPNLAGETPLHLAIKEK